MCRVFAYISLEPILLDDVLERPINAITKQIAAEWQDTPFYNVDGYGFTWYSDHRAKFNPVPDRLKTLAKSGPANSEARTKDGPLLPFVKGPHPAMYKTITAQPLNDPCFLSFCANISSRCIFGHMRAASSPPVSVPNCHPFVFGRHSFMYNGNIDYFDEVRKDIVQNIAPGFVAMMEGSTDTEHMAALYMTYLCPDGKKNYEGADDHYLAANMQTALKAAITKVQEIQKNHNIEKPDNFFNTCATDGESMIGLCYRTGGDPVPLWVSADAADHLNRKSCYLLHGTIDPPRGNVQEGGRVLREVAKPALTRGPNGGVTGIEQEILDQIEDEGTFPAAHGRHIIIASEPTTVALGQKAPHWYQFFNNEVILVDTAWDGGRKLTIGGASLA